MEAHPVPQNVTSFEFHLIGDMTLKQFGYLAAGLGFAYLVFIVLSTTSPFLAWPLIVLSSLFGVAFAFLPIEDRPLDWWVVAFFQAVFSPTKLKFKSEKLSVEWIDFKKRLNIYLSTAVSGEDQLSSASTLLPPTPVKIVALPEPEDLRKTVELAKQSQDINNRIAAAEGELGEIKSQVENKSSDPKLTQDFQKILDNITKLSKEASDISKKLEGTAQKPAIPPVAPTPVKAKSITNIVLTSMPNTINGIITDPSGNYLEGAIIVVHNRDGLPVRALKTNKLGQFTAATPLPLGTYIISTEKDNLVFDAVQTELKGEIIQPVIIQAKKEILV